MKKTISLMLVLISILALSSFTCVASYNPIESELPVQILNESQARGADAPNKNRIWTLANGGYNATFSYTANLYSNYWFVTETGEINVDIDSDQTDVGNYYPVSDLQGLRLLRKKLIGTETVGEYNIDRVGETSVTFNSLSEDSQYVLWLTKATDTVELSGSIQVYQ